MSETVLLFAMVIIGAVGIPVLFYVCGNFIDKYRNNPKVSGIMLLLFFVPVILFTIYTATHAVNAGLNIKNILYLAVIPSIIFATVILVLLFRASIEKNS